MTDNPISDSALHMRLTAYLDGELGDEDHHDVEQKLLSDQQYRKAMQDMQKTWDLLDHLPTSRVSNSFTQSTLEMVISETEQELSKRTFSPWTWPIRFGSLLAVTLVGLGASFGVTNWIKDRPNQSLRANVHVIENLTHLEYADSIEFLELLAEKEFFDDQVEELPEFDRVSQKWTDDWGSDKTTAAESHGTLKKYLDTASKDLIARLKTNRERFDLLTTDQQQKLNRLYTDIQRHNDHERLLETLELYQRWLQSLDEHERKNILNQNTAEQRTNRIANIRQAKPFTKFGLPEEDVPLFRIWLERMLYSTTGVIKFKYENADRMGLVRYPVVNAEVDDNSLSDEQIYKKYGQMLVALGETEGIPLTDVYGGKSKDAFLAQLKSVLTPEGVAAIEQDTNAEEVEFVFKWIKAALEAEWQPMAIQLKKFFDEELTERERSELDRYPPEQRKQILRQKFERHSNINSRPGR